MGLFCLFNVLQPGVIYIEPFLSNNFNDDALRGLLLDNRAGRLFEEMRTRRLLLV